MSIEFNHIENRHSLRGPRALLPALFEPATPASLIDVGCGIGTWAKTALDLGVQDVLGVDGVAVPPGQLLIPSQCFITQDLTQNWNLERQFDMALCLEVGEHLETSFAHQLVRNLVAHSSTIVFSAACPGQTGQHHVNCQWPVFWQNLFNAEGFLCDDALRWKIWNDCRIEPWYRQNIFVAKRNPGRAGAEARLQPVIHPEFLYGPDYAAVKNARFSSATAIEQGGMTLSWYLRTPIIGLTSKLGNRIRRTKPAPATK